MMNEYIAMKDAVISFLDDFCCCDPGGHYIIVSPTQEHTKAVLWPVIADYATDLSGCTVDDMHLSILLPTMTEVRCFGADRIHLLRGIKFSGAVFLECPNHERIVKMLALRDKKAEAPLPTPKFGLT